MVTRLLIALGLMLGAGVTQDHPQKVEFYIAPSCIDGAKAMEDTYCAGPDKEHLTCQHIKLTFHCSEWRVTR